MFLGLDHYSGSLNKSSTLLKTFKKRWNRGKKGFHALTLNIYSHLEISGVTNMNCGEIIMIPSILIKNFEFKLDRINYVQK